MKNRTIYISNLPVKLSVKNLKLNLYILLSHYGPILNIEVPRKYSLRGTAFITFNDSFAIDSVLSTTLPEFFGKTLKVEASKKLSKVELIASQTGLKPKFYFNILNFPTKIVAKIATRLFKNLKGLIDFEVVEEEGVNSILKLNFDTEENMLTAMESVSKIKLAGSELICRKAI